MFLNIFCQKVVVYRSNQESQKKKYKCICSWSIFFLQSRKSYLEQGYLWLNFDSDGIPDFFFLNQAALVYI